MASMYYSADFCAALFIYLFILLHESLYVFFIKAYWLDSSLANSCFASKALAFIASVKSKGLEQRDQVETREIN